jgi:ABC-type amino acid transport substrate-binding protein
LLLLLTPLLLAAAPAPEPKPDSGVSSPEKTVLSVAVREVAPFAMKDPNDGSWGGISVDLWRRIAERLDLEYEWREVPLADTWEALENGSVAVAISALSITAERQERHDFSHPYHVSGLAPAYRASGDSSWLGALEAFLSPAFLRAVGSLLLVLLIAGALVWLFERRANADQFGRGSLLRGLGDGLWWSAVTMTTVGYGDKAPKSLLGRLVGLIWMFASLIIIASFTASIAASLTANRLAEDQLRQLPIGKLRAGVVRGTAGEDYVERAGGRLRAAETLDEALELLRGGEVQVVVHDAPLLKHAIRERFQDLDVGARILARDDYGFAYTAGTELRRPVNGELLEILQESEWRETLLRYLGPDPR